MWNSRKAQPVLPKVPEGIRVYAIGDVHGRADLLDRLFAQIDRDRAAHPIGRVIQVFLGDYIDRGPDSRGVLDRLIKRGNSHETVFLKGNHEQFVDEFLRKPQILEEWKQFGGFETLVSFGLKPTANPDATEQAELAKAFAAALSETHRQFLKDLRLSFSCGDYFFVHAGVRPGIPLRLQEEQDLIWIRDEFIRSEEDYGKIIIHGHTPVREPDIRSNRINIDTGAFATGRLTCLMLEGQEVAIIAERHDGQQGE